MLHVQDRIHFQTDELSLADDLTADDTADVDAGAAPSTQADANGDADAGGGDALPPGEAAPTWTGPAQDEWEDLRESNAEMMAIIRGWAEQPDDDGQGQQQGDAFDPATLSPFDDDFGPNLIQGLRGEFQQMLAPIQQALGMVTAHTNQQVNQEGRERAIDIVTDYAKAGGVADPKPAVHEIALDMLSSVVPEFERRYGQNSVKAVEMGLRASTDRLLAWRKQEREEAVNEYKASLETHAGARGEMSGSTGSSVVGMPDFEDEMAVARHFGRNA